MVRGRSPTRHSLYSLVDVQRSPKLRRSTFKAARSALSASTPRSGLIMNSGADHKFGCPLWVTSGHMQCKKPRPLYSRERHQMRHMECPLWAKSGHRVTHSITSSASCWRSNGTSRSKNATPPHKRRLACLGTVARAGAPPAPSVWPLLQYREAVGIVAHTGDSRDHLPAPEIDHPHCPARRSAGSKARPARDDSVASV